MNNYEIWHKGHGGVAEIEPEHLDTIQAESELHALCLFLSKNPTKAVFHRSDDTFRWKTLGEGLLTLEAKLAPVHSST